MLDPCDRIGDKGYIGRTMITPIKKINESELLDWQKPSTAHTFSSVKVLIKRIQDYITHWNSKAEPFVWTATADEILAKVRLVQSNIKKLLDNNAK